MQNVVCQLVGFGLVPRYVMKAIGVEGTMGCMELLLDQLWLLYQFIWNPADLTYTVIYRHMTTYTRYMTPYPMPCHMGSYTEYIEVYTFPEFLY